MILPSFRGIYKPLTASSPVAVEATATNVKFAGDATARTTSLTITANTKMVVAVIGAYRASGVSLSAVTYNGTAMTLGKSKVTGSFGAYIYYILQASLPSAGSYNISVTPGATGHYGGTWGYALTGAAQAAPEATGEGYSSTSVSSWTNSVTTISANTLILDVNAGYDRTFTPNSGQTEGADFTDAATAGVCGGWEQIASAGSEAMAWTPSTSTPYIQAIACFKPA